MCEMFNDSDREIRNTAAFERVLLIGPIDRTDKNRTVCWEISDTQELCDHFRTGDRCKSCEYDENTDPVLFSAL
jgi:hypothetical protein